MKFDKTPLTLKFHVSSSNLIIQNKTCRKKGEFVEYSYSKI